MTEVFHIQKAFSAGELDPDLYARDDIDKYDRGAKEIINWNVLLQGGLENRSGLEHINFSQERTYTPFLYRFQFNTLQTYVLEFGHEYVRILKDGAVVVSTTTQNIVSVVTTNPLRVEVAGHGLSDGTVIYVQGVSGMTEINDKFFIVGDSTTDEFDLHDLFDENIDASGYGTYTSGGTVAETATYTTPYQYDELFDLTFTQSNDVLTIAHPEHVTKELTRTADDAWTLTDKSFDPEITAPSNVAASVDSGSGSISYTYVVTSISEETGEESLASSEASVNNDLTGSGAANLIEWDAEADALEYNVYKEYNGLFGYIGTTRDTEFVDNFIEADVTDTPPDEYTPFDSTDNYPAAVAYHQQRQYFGRTNNAPQTIWGTQAGVFNNLTSSSPPKDGDGFRFTLDSDQVNAIRHLLSFEDLLVFTSGGEFRVFGEGGPLGPLTFSAKRQTNFGIGNVPPIVVADTVLFVDASGTKIHDFFYSFEKDGYTAVDRTILAKHLFEDDTIVDWTYARLPNNQIFCVMESGQVNVFTFLKEQNTWAWTQMQTDGNFKSVTSIREGAVETPYFIVEREVNGGTYNFVERMRRRKRAFEPVEDSFFVDAGLSYDNPIPISNIEVSGSKVVVTTSSAHGLTTSDIVKLDDMPRMSYLDQMNFNIDAVTSTTIDITEFEDDGEIDLDKVNDYLTTYGGNARKTTSSVSGLEHIEGREVVILADGKVIEGKTVSEGSVSLGKNYGRVHVGLSYNCDLRPLPLSTLTSTSGGANIRGYKVSIPRAKIRFKDTRGVAIGPDEENLEDMNNRKYERPGEPTETYTGVRKLAVRSTWSEDGNLLIRQRYPLPATILSLMPEVRFED